MTSVIAVNPGFGRDDGPGTAKVVSVLDPDMSLQVACPCEGVATIGTGKLG